MNIRYIYLTGGAFLFFLSGWFWQSHTEGSYPLNRYAQKIEKYLQQQEEDINATLQDTAFFHRQINGKQDDIDIERLKIIEKKPFTICIYRKDSLVFWSNNNIIPDQGTLKNLPTNNRLSRSKLSNGQYAIKQQKVLLGNDSLTIFSATLLYAEFSLESDILKKCFLADNSISSSVYLLNSHTDYAIHDTHNEVFCYLSTSKPIRDIYQQVISFSLYALGFICICFLINILTKKIAVQYASWAGAAFLIISAFSIRFFTLAIDVFENFREFRLFAKADSVSFVFSNSLGDLLINVLVLLWVILLFYREFKLEVLIPMNRNNKLFITIIYYFAIIFGIFWVIRVYKDLVMYNLITFDYDNIFGVDGYVFLASVCIILLLFSLFLFSFRILKVVEITGLDKKDRLICLIGATLCVYLWHYCSTYPCLYFYYVFFPFVILKHSIIF